MHFWLFQRWNWLPPGFKEKIGWRLCTCLGRIVCKTTTLESTDPRLSRHQITRASMHPLIYIMEFVSGSARRTAVCWIFLLLKPFKLFIVGRWGKMRALWLSWILISYQHSFVCFWQQIASIFLVLLVTPNGSATLACQTMKTNCWQRDGLYSLYLKMLFSCIRSSQIRSAMLACTFQSTCSGKPIKIPLPVLQIDQNSQHKHLRWITSQLQLQ